MATPASGREVEHDVVVAGGCGPVGLPLAIAFADRGARVAIYDVSESAVGLVNAGRLRSTVFPGVTALVEKMVTIDKPVAGIGNVLGEGVLA
jgi:UDP-N-acetyl-D-mannosaminuronic acid dehydrogenase